MVSSSRFSQLRKVSYKANTEREKLREESRNKKSKKKELLELLKFYKDLTLSYISDDILENNKKKKSPLRTFVRTYISKLTKKELDYMWNRIYNYTNLLEDSNFITDKVGYSSKLYHIIQYPDEYNQETVFFELLYNLVYLPDYKDTKQFYSEMVEVIKNLDNFVYKYFNQHPFKIRTLSTDIVWEAIQTSKGEKSITSTLIPGHYLVERVTYNADLPALERKRVNEAGNEVSLTFGISHYPGQSDIKDLLKLFLDRKVEKGEISKDLEGNYLFANLPYMTVHIEVSELDLSSIEEYNGKELFEVRVYTKPKSHLTSFRDYINYSNAHIVNIASELASLFDLKNLYGNLVDIILEDLDKNGLDEELKEKLEDYLDAKTYDKIIKNIEDKKIDKAKKKIEKAFSKVLRRHFKQMTYDYTYYLRKEIYDAYLDEKTISEIKNKLSFYLDYTSVSEIEKLLQENKRDEAVKLIKKKFNEIADRFLGNRTILLDFNEGLMDSLEEINKEYKKDQNETDSESLSKTTKSLLKKVDPTDLVPRLFLSEETKHGIDLMYNYLKNREEKEKKMIKPLKGAILNGPPGVGKTETAKKIAKELGIPLYIFKAGDILGQFQGQTEKATEWLFEEYRKILKKGPAILFIDEADTFLGKRGDGNRDLKDNMRGIFLSEIEGVASSMPGSFIMLGTNYPDLIDEALKERLGIYIEYKLPDDKLINDFFDYIFDEFLKEKGWKVSITKEDKKKLANKVKGWSFRKITNLINITLAFVEGNEIKLEDILKNINLAKDSKQTDGNPMGFIRK